MNMAEETPALNDPACLIVPIIEVRLPTFYNRLASSSSYYILILALIRDADAPSFYADVERYWNSLNDVTGDQVLFGLAAEGAATRFGRYILDDFYSSFIAVPKTTIIPMSGRIDLADIQRARRSIRAANTSQVSELRDFLNLTEKDIPCLHLTLLKSNPKRTIVLPLKDIPNFSIYALCKNIMSCLQPTLAKFKKPWALMPESKKHDTQSALDKVLEGQFLSLSSLAQRPITEHRWDFFISYPEKAQDLATAVFKALENIIIDVTTNSPRVFMDHFCLIAGQN
jgi:hypothetical protein